MVIHSGIRPVLFPVIPRLATTPALQSNTFHFGGPGTFPILPKRNEGASHEMDERAGRDGRGTMYKQAFVHCCGVERDGDKVLCAGQMSCLGMSVNTRSVSSVGWKAACATGR